MLYSVSLLKAKMFLTQSKTTLSVLVIAHGVMLSLPTVRLFFPDLNGILNGFRRCPLTELPDCEGANLRLPFLNTASSMMSISQPNDQSTPHTTLLIMESINEKLMHSKRANSCTARI